MDFESVTGFGSEGVMMSWFESFIGEREKTQHGAHALTLVVRFEGEKCEFQIPACGHAGVGEYFPFDWNIDWGDGERERATGLSSSRGGEVSMGSLVHVYATPGEYLITISPNGSVCKTAGDAPGWLQAFGYPESWMFSVNDEGCFEEYVFPKGGDRLVCVDGVLDDYAINIELEGACAEMFTGCKSITMGPHFTISSDKERAGDFFCFKMFSKCEGAAFTMGNAFQLPQNLREVGEAFCCKMFQYCYGKSFTMNAAFTIPQKIIAIKSGFCQEMFSEHGLGLTMGRNFNLPQGITEAADRFCADMFSFSGIGDMKSEPAFSMNDVFNLPALISGHVGNDFCTGMFRCNRGNSFRMNRCFNLPQGITSAGNAFCKQMFQGCSGDSFSMNDVFTMPGNLNRVGSECCMWMFSSCDGAGFHVNPSFDFPYALNGLDYLCYEMFGECRSDSLNWSVRDIDERNPQLRIWSPPYDQICW